MLDASLSVMLILYLAGRLVHKCYLEINKSFQLCWVAIVRVAAVGLKTDGLIRMEDLAPIRFSEGKQVWVSRRPGW